MRIFFNCTLDLLPWMSVSFRCPDTVVHRVRDTLHTIRGHAARDGVLVAYNGALTTCVEEWELRPHVVPGPKGREREREVAYT